MLCRRRFAIEADLSAALDHALADDALCVVATPVAGLRGLFQAMRDAGKVPAHVVWLCKGFEADSQLLPHQVVAAELPEHGSNGVLSGPSFAREVGQGLPVALTVASTSAACRERTVAAFHHGAMRIYTGDDIVGVEVGGAVKNVLAIATGIADGLGLGLNARAALITRGLAEMSRLGVTLGGRAETFTGLTGLGDLILTATGDLSRNRTVGMQLAAGRTLDDILGAPRSRGRRRALCASGTGDSARSCDRDADHAGGLRRAVRRRGASRRRQRPAAARFESRISLVFQPFGAETR